MTLNLQPVAETAFPGRAALAGRASPSVFRGRAAHWPAVRDWTFARLAPRVPDAPVRVVEGNREEGATRFATSTLRHYIAGLDESSGAVAQVPYLKEFDLLRTAPALQADLHHRELLPRGSLASLRSWIGPAGGKTGLHHDYLDNIAVQVLGRKRWRLARPGTVERLRLVSTKYDAWAVLSACSVEQLAGQGARAEDLFEVETGPGDVLHVPAGWWHEVQNLSPSLLFGGFHGPAPAVLARWAWVAARNARHRWGRLGRGDCTCHPA
ncbi:cupin-like domain-containing protein [Ideonella sp. YS5]|uniref:cupin-like domain-containing protein n=1 Tax=Ideonella sp. YS5 TaxID=3453714 RepID=UPI003EEA2ADB